MRVGDQIGEHRHGTYPYTFDYFSGHLGIMVDGTTSTYYRTISMRTELRFDTASKVLDAIYEQERRQNAAAIAKQLRSDNPDVSRSEARAGVKPRKISP